MSEEKVNAITGEIVTADSKKELADLNSVFSNDSKSQLVSLTGDSSDPLSQLQDVNDFGGEAEGLQDATNLEIGVKNVVLGVVTLQDNQTGKAREAIRAVIITDDGKKYSTESESAIRKLSQYVVIARNAGLKLGEQPLVVKVKKVKTRNGYNALDLELNIDKFKKALGK